MQTTLKNSKVVWNYLCYSESRSADTHHGRLCNSSLSSP